MGISGSSNNRDSSHYHNMYSWSIHYSVPDHLNSRFISKQLAEIIQNAT